MSNISNRLSVLMKADTMKRIFSAAVIVMTFAGCSKIAVTEPDVSATSVLKITPEEATVPFGSAVQFKAKLIKADGQIKDVTDQVEWQLKDQVNARTAGAASLAAGRLTPVLIGPLGVQAIYRSVSATAEVLITTQPVSLAIVPSSAALARGVPQQFKALATYDDGIVRDVTSAVTWQSDDLSVVGFPGSDSGFVQAASAGSTQIKASLGDLEAIGAVAVSGTTLSSISLFPDRALLLKNERNDLLVTAHYADGTSYDVTRVSNFSVSDATLASVMQIGESSTLVGLAPGDFEMNATFSSLTAHGQYSVVPSIPSNLSLTGGSSLPLGDSGNYRAQANFADGSSQDVSRGAIWTSSQSAIVQLTNVAQSPVVVKALALGSSLLQIEGLNLSGSQLISVGAAALRSIAINPSPASVPAGRTLQLSALGTYTDGSTSNLTGSAIWSSDAASKALISASGLLSGVQMGNANITATVGSVSKSVAASVSAPLLQSLAVSLSPQSVAAGYTSQAAAVGTYSDGSTQTLTTSALWSSGNASVASINSSSGAINALAIGSSVISANVGGVIGTANLSVSAPILTGLSLNLAPASVAKGNASQGQATASYSDGSTVNVTSSASWSSGTPSVAAVSSTGAISSLAQGSSLITASFGTRTASRSLSVTAPVLTALNVALAPSSIAKGYSGQATATGVYSDGSTVNLTNSSVWSSDTTSVASVNSVGVIGSVAAGTSLISASYGGFNGSATVTITAPTAVSLALSFNKIHGGRL
ncbi:MAG: hypothetical protein EOP06_01725 [Proteobacteria bacterium]|nr:MAG: hypothetical protein EOP06_01725 [Pseudomonadota bacterium]